jgi:exonuclease III
MQLRIPQLTALPEQLQQSLLSHHGDELPPTAPSKGITRIGFQNVHGIGRGLNPAEEFISVMNDYHFDIFGGAEVNCEWTDDLRCRVDANAQKKFGNSLLSTASTKFKSKHGYLPGGVMQLSRGEIISRQAQQGSDTIGRYTWHRFSGKKNQKLCIITAYRVSQHKNFNGIGKEDSTAHRQQVIALLKRGILDPDPKQQILHDLSKFIQKQRQEGYEVILMMDSNESTKAKGSKLTEFMIANDLIDIHAYRHSEGPQTTRMGSTNVIDHILVSEGVIDYVTACGHMAFQEGCLSDHIMLWMEFNSRKFFGGRGPKIVRPAAREFKFNNTVLREKFISELRTKFEHQQIKRRVHDVADDFLNQKDHQQAIKRYLAIDRDIISSIKGTARREQ